MKTANGTLRSLFFTTLARRTRAISKRLVRSERGSVTIEFVFVVPLMLFVLLGFSELYMYMRAVSLVEHTAFTLADTIGQMTSVIDDNTDTTNSNSLGSIWAAATVLATPNQLQANGGVIVTSICDTVSNNCGGNWVTVQPTSAWRTTGTPYVNWTRKPVWQPSGMATKLSTGNLVPTTWPFQKGDSAVAVEVFYRYKVFSMTVPFWHSAPGTVTIYERVYVRPRNGQSLYWKTGT